VAEVHRAITPASKAVKHEGLRFRRVLVKFAGLNPSGERMQILKAGVLYFAMVFGAGFVLGPIGIVWVAPRIGARLAEVFEAPIMLLISIVAARWVVRSFAVPPTPASRIGMGGIGLGLMLIAEFTVVLWLRGLSIRDYLAGRDPVAATVYYAMLGVFAVLPMLMARK
jgi:hypothetical protein